MFYNFTDRKQTVEVEYQNVVWKKVGNNYTEFVKEDKWFGDFVCPKPDDEAGEEFASYGTADLQREKSANPERGFLSGVLGAGDYMLRCYTRVRPLSLPGEIEEDEERFFTIA